MHFQIVRTLKHSSYNHVISDNVMLRFTLRDPIFVLVQTAESLPYLFFTFNFDLNFSNSYNLLSFLVKHYSSLFFIYF
jgi:hypothetical protein